MPMEYDIHEAGDEKPVWRDTKYTKNDAKEAAEQLRDEEGKNFIVSPRFVPVSEAVTKPFSPAPVTAEEIYKEVHGAEANFADAPWKMRFLYEALAEAAGEVLRENPPRGGNLQLGDID